MGKHIIDGPFAAAGGAVQSSSRLTRGECDDLFRLLGEPHQDLVDRERRVVHGDTCCITTTGPIRDSGSVLRTIPRARATMPNIALKEARRDVRTLAHRRR